MYHEYMGAGFPSPRKFYPWNMYCMVTNKKNSLTLSMNRVSLSIEQLVKKSFNRKEKFKMKKMNLLTMLIVLLIFSLFGQVHAEESLDVFIEGEKQVFESGAFIYENRTLIPARDVSEALGATVYWDTETNTVNIVKGDVTLFFIIGASTATVNNQIVELDTKPLIIDSYAFVPLRLISEAFGANVEWDGKNNNVYISTVGNLESYFTSDFLELAAEGKLKGCDYSLNNNITASTILAAKGVPEVEGTTGGSHYLTYDQCQYHVSLSEYNKGNTVDAELLSIKHISESISTTPAEVKTQLGIPFSEGKSELNELWTLTYLAGEYKVILTAKSESSAITQIHLKENQATTLDLELKHTVTTEGDDRILFYVRNPLDIKQILQFHSGQEYDYRLLKDGEQIEQYSATRLFIQTQHSITLEPNEVLIYSSVFSSLDPGEYVIEFWLTSYSHDDTKTSMTFTVE